VKKILQLLLLPLLFFTLACEKAPKNNTTNTVIIREKNDASTLNPTAASNQLSAYAGMQIFQTLINIDFKTEKTVGVLATAPAVIDYDSLGKMQATYTIRKCKF